MTLLQQTLVYNILKEQDEARAAQPPRPEAEARTIFQIADILVELNKQTGLSQTGLSSVDPYFEARVAMEEKQATMGVQEMDWNKLFMDTRSEIDGSAALRLDIPTTRKQMKQVFIEMGLLVREALTSITVEGAKRMLQARQVGATIIKIVAIPMGLVTAALAYLGLKSASAAATAAATSAAGATAGPVAALITYVAMPSSDFIAGIGSLVAGTAAGGALFMVGTKVDPSQAQIRALNDELKLLGKEPLQEKEIQRKRMGCCKSRMGRESVQVGYGGLALNCQPLQKRACTPRAEP